MEYRTLGRSRVWVSPMCLGCMNFGNRTEEDESIRIIDAAIDAGINFIDTANTYGRGVSERIVGKALAPSNKRDQVFLATKFSGRMGQDPNARGHSRYHLLQQIDESLQRLQTDHVDLYQVHVMDTEAPLDELLSTLNDLVRIGKVRYIGVSKWAPALLVEALMLAERYGWEKFLTEQPPYNLLDRRIEDELIWVCQRHGLGIMPWAPIAAGLLSGKYTKDHIPEGGRFKDFNRRLTHEALDRIEAFKQLADEKDVTPAELALAWCMNQPGITAPIIGPRTMEHLQSSLKAVDIAFTTDDYQRIDAIFPPGSAASNYYEGNVYTKLRRGRTYR